MSAMYLADDGGSLIPRARLAALAALPALTAVFLGLTCIVPGAAWADWPFKIFLAGTVGIWTNYFAIRMLFRPRERTAFGRQGLIPARRDDLAEAVAGAVAEELLDSETLLGYVEREALVEKLAEQGLARARAWLAEPRNRQEVVARLGRWIRDKGAECFDRAVPALSAGLLEILNERVRPETVWPLVEEALKRELAKTEARQAAARVLLDLAERNSGAVARLVNGMLDDWILKQEGLKGAALLFGKIYFRVDEGHVRKELVRAVRDPGFFEKLLAMVEENIPVLLGVGNDPAFKGRLASLLEGEKGRFENWLRGEGMGLARERLLKYLESGEFWSWLDERLASAVARLEVYAREKISSPEFRAAAREWLIRAADSIEIRRVVREKVSEFELERLEGLVRKVSGENLCGIELFGGILGMIAGLVLISPLWVVIVPAAFGAFLLAERLASRKPIPETN